MDANFCLVRNHNSGTSPSPSAYATEFFVDADEVNTFVQSYGSDNQKDKVVEESELFDVIFELWKTVSIISFLIANILHVFALKLIFQECRNFLAGNAVRSRARNAKLDILGVFGSVCRHEYPVLFMDMKHGER